VHKSGILHEKLKPLWQLAKMSLADADRILIFGYSCPFNDWESANLIAGALSSNREAILEVIDIDPGVVVRYATLGNLDSLSFYSSADAFLSIPA
jgi:hypothetical protein